MQCLSLPLCSRSMSIDFLEGRFAQVFSSLEEKIALYQTRIQRRKGRYDHACQTAKKEIQQDFAQFIELAKYSKDADIPFEMIVLGKDLIGSSIWVLHCYLKYLRSFIELYQQHRPLPSQDHDRILWAIRNKTPYKEIGFSPSQIFQAVFRDLCDESKRHDYTSQLECPPIKTTIVLVSGVFNELYRSAAFERGMLHLQEKFGIKYFVPRVHGRRGSTHNAQLLKTQLDEYVRDHPGEKLWILAHSKGGIDALHFLRRDTEFASNHIVGISTIASPIMGTPHADHLVVRMIQIFIKLENTTIYQKLDRGRDLLSKNVPLYLSENFQKTWFERNSKDLPSNIFYSSMALESKWYKTHIWMVFAKFLFKNKGPNDGIVNVEQAHFPNYFSHINLGTIEGHHLSGIRSSVFNQEALMQAHVITLNYLGLLQ